MTSVATSPTEAGALFAPTQDAVGGGFTSRDALHLLFKHGRVIAGCTLLVTALVWAGAAVQPSTYNGSAKLWIKTEQQNTPTFLTGLAAPTREAVSPDPANRKIETEMELLLSRDNAERVIRELKIRPEQLARPPLAVISDHLPKVKLFKSADAEASASPDEVSQGLITLFIKSFKVEALRSKSADTTSNVVELTFSAADPELVPKALAAMLQEYTALATKQNRDLGAATFKLLESKAEEARRDLQQSEQALQSFLAANGDHTSRQSVIGRTDAPSGSNVVAAMKSQNADLQQKLDDLRQIYTEEAQNVKALSQSITNLQQRMRGEVRANAVADAELARLERQRSLAQDRFVELRRRLDQIDLFLKVNPPEADSRVITQTAARPRVPDNTKRQLAFLLAPLGGLLLGMAFAAMRQLSDHRMETPEELAKSLGLEVLAAVPVLSADTPVAHQLDASDAAGGPLTSATPSAHAQSLALERASSEGVSLLPDDAEDLHREARELHRRRRALQTADGAREDAAEITPLRTVRANDRGLLMHRLALRVRDHLPGNGRGRILLVSSARENEGKSVIARALAKRLLQQQRGRVLLIDANAEAPAGHAGSRAHGRAGFFDLLREPQAHASAVVGRNDPRLHILGHGQNLDGSLLYHESSVQELFAKLRERYHWTVIDAGTLPRIGCLGSQADGVLLVVDAQSTRREVVRGALDTARLPAGRLLGAVLNRRPQYVPAWAYRNWL